MNVFCLTGRLTKDPEVNYTPNETAVCNPTIAVDRFDKQADFIRITVFGKQAESLAKYKHKGDLIEVVGRVQTGSYEKDGKRIYTTDFIAQNVKFLGGKRENEPEKTESFEDIGFAATDEDIPF